MWPCICWSLCTYHLGDGFECTCMTPKLLKSFVYVITDKKLYKWADETQNICSGAPDLLYDPRSGVIDITDITGITEGFPEKANTPCFPENCCGTSRAGYVTMGCVPFRAFPSLRVCSLSHVCSRPAFASHFAMFRVPSIPVGHPLAGFGSKHVPGSKFVMLADDPGAVVKLITELKQSANPSVSVAVKVPPGVRPGQALEVPLPDGRRMRVVVPEGVQPGATFQAKAPAAMTMQRDDPLAKITQLK